MNNDRNTNCTDVAIKNNKKSMQKHLICLLYTSDAADE